MQIDPRDHVNLIHWTFHHYYKGLRHEEYVGVGYMALHHAAKNYRPESGAAFSSVATRYIRAYVSRQLRKDRRSLLSYWDRQVF